MLRIAVLASHEGTIFQALVNFCRQRNVTAKVVLLICNNSNAPVMQRARKAKIKASHFSSITHPSKGMLDIAINRELINENIDLIVLAGYMKKLGPSVLGSHENRIINVHPSLLPKYGGLGFYGSRVHEAVIKSGDRETGATVHLVTEDYDSGKRLFQERVKVNSDDTPGSLAKRLKPLEQNLLFNAIKQFAAEKK
jgi:phosphoribosylglycinamide formyltransferase-1